MRATKKAWLTAAAGTTAGLVGLGLIAMPAGAGAAPKLPDVSAEKLVTSVLEAKPPALSGTVEMDNNLGLPALPEMGSGSAPSLNFDSAQVHTNGKDSARVSFNEGNSEKTFLTDGRTAWSWDSAARSATKTPVPDHPEGKRQHEATSNPATAARELVGQIRESSTVRVDGTARVADRPAYEMVLTPKPSERTLMREVRVAVDSETRLPLRFTALANGSSEPALQIEFTEFDVGPQPKDLFRFTPPEGTKVTEHKLEKHGKRPNMDEPTVVGKGWDSVVVLDGANLGGDDKRGGDPKAMLDRIGKKVSGPWGNGWLIGTNVGNALITDDQRMAVGAVPQQVLTEALEQTK